MKDVKKEDKITGYSIKSLHRPSPAMISLLVSVWFSTGHMVGEPFAKQTKWSSVQMVRLSIIWILNDVKNRNIQIILVWATINLNTKNLDLSEYWKKFNLLFKWHLNIGLFGDCSIFDLLNTRLVQYSDLHCISLAFTFYLRYNPRLVVVYVFWSNRSVFAP